jgi:hypothetical protein
MAVTRLRSLACVFVVLLTIPFPLSALDTPLSDTAVRQAYFMGQRHDESLTRFLDSYTKQLSQLKTGPNIASVSLLTPFALLVEFSNAQPYGYSAQQAELDHRHLVETVKIVVVIRLTDTYSGVLRNPAAHTTGNPADYLLRPADFWRDFQIQVLNADSKEPIKYFAYNGEPDYICGDIVCTLIGATVQMEFLADTFSADTATVQIDPPEGDQVAVSFDLSSLR